MEYFPTKVKYCKIWQELTLAWVSEIGEASHSAWLSREDHVKNCAQCNAAQQSVHLTRFPQCKMCEYNPCDLANNSDYCPARK